MDPLIRIFLCILIIYLIIKIILSIRSNGSKSLLPSFFGGSDKRPIIKYKFNNLPSDNKYELTEEIANDFAKQTRKIITESKWNKLYNLQQTKNRNDYNFTIKILPRETMNKEELKGAVKYDTDGQAIYYSRTWLRKIPAIEIDATNWINGVARSQLKPAEYREYVINHEVGHALGYDHAKCENGQCPVMHQMTAGVPAGNLPTTQPIQSDLNAERTLLHLMK